MTQLDCEVIVAGGGPAGSTVASLLAQKGHAVVVVEKETFPRFHIGESLLPAGLAVFRRLGFNPEEGGAYLRKAGAEFHDESTGRSATFLFADGLEGTPSYAWQVERSKFDHDLLKRSRAFGAVVREGLKINDWAIHADWVEVFTDEGTLRGRYFVDATGQDALIGRRAKSIEPIKGFGIGAQFTHFSGISSAVEEELFESGNIRVLLRKSAGWMWIIPLTGKKISVGVVHDKKAPALTFDEEIQRSPMIQRLTAGATRVEPRTIRNFSYRNRKLSGPRWACVGDAACFLDPVFSSGVSLALLSGEHLADALARALDERSEASPDVAQDLTAHMERGYLTFASIIGSFYQTNLADHLFFHEDADPISRRGLISILAGDVWRSDNRFQEVLIRGRRSAATTAVFTD